MKCCMMGEETFFFMLLLALFYGLNYLIISMLTTLFVVYTFSADVFKDAFIGLFSVQILVHHFF